MTFADTLRFALANLASNRLRTALMMSAMSIGVAAVVVLTALGDGARNYVIDQFSSLGTNLLIVFPGRTETSGAAPGMLVANTPRDLTLEDALSLNRERGVQYVAPLAVGSAAVSWNTRNRDGVVLGATAEYAAVRHLVLAQGKFLPSGDAKLPQPVVVLGTKIRQELFGSHAAIGEWVRIGDRRFRVIGVLTPVGQALGMDMDEVAMIPVASAQALFNRYSLVRILISTRERAQLDSVKVAVERALTLRHEGERDVTVITQDALLSTFDRILSALTLAVAGIAAISLAVAGILIMNVMLITVTQRTREIGLLKALGATPQDIRRMFLAEAIVLATAGALLGWALGQAGSWLLLAAYPTLPIAPPWWAVVTALATAMGTGTLFSLLPARRASRLDAVQALAGR